LMMYAPRQRKQVKQFGPDGIEADDNSDDDFGIEGAPVKSKTGADKDGPKLWTMTEKNRFERCLMLWGFASWDMMLPQFARRTVEDLEAIAKLVITFCLNTGQVDMDTNAEMRRMIGLEPWIAPEVEEGIEAPMPDKIELPPIPYIDATERQITEYRSYLLDTTPEYHDHIEKKGEFRHCFMP
jgi:hypothetical protein